MDIIDINDSYRYIDVTDDLIPIETIKATKYDFKIPTIVPNNWSSYNETSQEKYTMEFNRKHHIIGEILKETSNVVVAGGAAARPLYATNKNIYTDIDIFIYGIFSEELFWDKVNELVQKIMGKTAKNNRDVCMTQKMKKGIVIIGVLSRAGQLIIEYQIILRMYHTISSIIHAFDIPSCCIAFDGITAYTTTLGAYAHANQVNLVSTKYRSISFEHRLIKYFIRGFGLGLIGYNINKGYDKESSVLLHKYLNIDVSYIQDNHVVGTIDVTFHNNINIYLEDYASIKPRIYTCTDFTKHLQCIEGDGIILRQNSHRPIDYTIFYQMTAYKIIELFPDGVNKIIEKQSRKIQHLEMGYLTSIKLPKKIIHEIVDIILGSINVNEKLTNLLYEQIKVHANYIPEWIIIQDPQRQYTASINPIIGNPEDWYGSDLYIQ